MPFENAIQPIMMCWGHSELKPGYFNGPYYKIINLIYFICC